MTMLGVIATSLVWTAAATAAGPKLFRVNQLIKDQPSMVGQRIKIRGWLLRPCRNLDCALYATADDVSPHISVGKAGVFDAASAPSAGREILIEATVSAHCWPQSGYRCTDRGDQLADPVFLRAFP